LFRTAQIWGHENTRLALFERGEDARRRVLEYLPREHHQAVRRVEIVPPDHTFSDQVSLDIGRPVHLRYHGRGHTDSDITIDVDEVLFAGDLVEEAAPPAFGDAFPLEWADTLGSLLDFVRGPVVPGHGEPVDRAFVEQQRADITATVEIARAGFRSGLPADQIDVRPTPFPAELSRFIIERSYAQLAGQI
jgi:glyoxylase-like metal-dependent hydrolase (beta-lactamase superfamily II)